MHPFLSTLLLLCAALVFGTLSYLQVREGNLDSLLGTPPVTIGERIFPALDPEAVTEITLRNANHFARFEKTAQGWQASEPWQDRMDPRAAISIIAFTTATTAEDLAPRNKIDPDTSGIGENNIEISLRDGDGERLAHYRLGRRTPWLSLPSSEDEAQPIPTLFLLPLESGRKSHIYAATGDISPLLKDGFKFLRDHRPFFFNPATVQKIRLRSDLGEMTLGRANPQSPWRIVKPLDLPTDVTVMRNLLEGLYDLQAVKVTDRSELTLPVNGASKDTRQIAITAFGSEKEIVLEIFPPESADARETYALVSDRPDSVLTLLNKPEPDMVSLADLPLTVNDLRDPTLTNLHIASIMGISIESATAPQILISREGSAPWMATIQGRSQPANEQRLYELLKAVTSTRAAGFETDAAPEDLSPWGLHRPIVTLTFLARDSQRLSVALGLDQGGNLFAKREGSPSIMRLDESFLQQIATRSQDWRHARLWSINRVDLTHLHRTQMGENALEMQYNDLHESWLAFRDGNDLTSDLDPSRANFLLTALENLQVSRWLQAEDEVALAALEKPTLSFDITSNLVDDFGDEIGKETVQLLLAADPNRQLVFGKVSNDPNPFTIDPQDFLKLNISLLDQ